MAVVLPRLFASPSRFAAKLFNRTSLNGTAVQSTNEVYEHKSQHEDESHEAGAMSYEALMDYDGKARRYFRYNNELAGRHLWFETRIKRQTRAVESYIMELASLEQYEQDQIQAAIRMIEEFYEKLRSCAFVIQKRETQRFYKVQYRLAIRRRYQEEEMAQMAKDEYLYFYLPYRKAPGPKLGF